MIMAVLARSSTASLRGASGRRQQSAVSGRRTTVQVQAFQVTLRLPKGATKVLEVSKDESIMDAIDAAGLDLPYLCRSGACGTCAGRVLSGEVEQVGQHLLNPGHISAGFALMCSSYPRSDCEITTHQEEALLTAPDAYTSTRH